MTRDNRCARILATCLIPIALLMGAAGVARAEKLPPLWGYGVKSCAEFLSAADGEENGVGGLASDYDRYEDWLTGFISGLNLSTGKDVLRGADIDTALRRIHAYCGGHRKEDVFTATMDLVRMLSGLR